jgi:hypothetical protein
VTITIAPMPAMVQSCEVSMRCTTAAKASRAAEPGGLGMGHAAEALAYTCADRCRACEPVPGQLAAMRTGP